MATLHDPLVLGALRLRNRIIMAPLTRCRAADGRVPTALMAEYYRQRAGAGMILSEAVAISPMGVGYPDTPGLWSREQVEGWTQVTKAVHDAGGLIVAQLWHVGRISDPVYLNRALPVAPSAIAPEGTVSLVRPKKNFEVPRALELEEIPGIIEDYRRAAQHAKEAGFDGVELHGANGYLPHQFLNTGSNKRTDRYGGSVENRARFMLEAIDALISVWGADRVGIHLSPAESTHTMDRSQSLEAYLYLMDEVQKRCLAFVFAREPEGIQPRFVPQMRQRFKGALILNDSFTRESGEAALARGEGDAVSYGKPFIANPDLPRRFALGAPLNEVDLDTLYMTKGPTAGYTDYPALAD